MPSHRLAPRFHLISRLIRRNSDQDLAVLGIPSGQKDVLWEVLENPGIHQTALVERLHLHKSVVSRALASLEIAGFIQRRVPREKNAPRALYPAPLAAALQKYTHRSLDHLERAICRGFSREERRQFDLSLQRITRNLERQLEGDSDPFVKDVIKHMKILGSAPWVD